MGVVFAVGCDDGVAVEDGSLRGEDTAAEKLATAVGRGEGEGAGLAARTDRGTSKAKTPARTNSVVFGKRDSWRRLPEAPRRLIDREYLNSQEW